MTDFEYIFCKDNSLVLILECLFAKASTVNVGAVQCCQISSPKAPQKNARYLNCQNSVIEFKSRLTSHFLTH